MATATASPKPQYARQRRLAERATRASNGEIGVKFCPGCSLSDEGYLDNPPSRDHQYFVSIGGELGKWLDEIWLDDREGDLTKQLADTLAMLGGMFQDAAELVRSNMPKKKSGKTAVALAAGEAGAA